MQNKILSDALKETERNNSLKTIRMGIINESAADMISSLEKDKETIEAFLIQGLLHISTVGLNKKAVQNYIRGQELEDQIADRRSLKEYKDPFTGK